MSVPLPSENVRHKTLAKSDFFLKKMKCAGFEKCLLVVLVSNFGGTIFWSVRCPVPVRPSKPKPGVFQNQKTVIFYFAFCGPVFTHSL
jgi:hypothetical protein